MNTQAMPPLQALVVAQAGPGVGLGHLSRALVVARALQHRLGAQVQLLVQGEALQRADLQAFAHQFIAPDADLAAAINARLPNAAASLLTLDLQPRRVPDQLAQALPGWRANGCKVVAIDGLLAWRALLDLVFIPSICFVPPPEPVSPSAVLLHGWDCLLIDPLPAPAPRWQAGPQVLALTGGSDATGLGAHWPALLDQTLPASSQLHWVTGPYARAPQWPAQTRLSAMQQHLAPAGLGPLMDRCQYAVSIFGVSVYELLQRGVPTVVFSPYGQQDDAALAALSAAGVALVAHDEADASRQLAALMADPVRAAALSHAASARLRRSGGDTLSLAVAALLGSATQPVGAQPAANPISPSTPDQTRPP